MCGIAVILPRPGRAVEPTDPAALAAALARRGPDVTGRWRSPVAGMWASRLILWDEGRAEQPAEIDGVVGCFNGELFNLDALRARLGRPGASEIEVLCAGVNRWGPAFLSGIDGQFAGVVVQVADGRAVAFRDRFGICPLYVTETPAGTAIASDLQALAAITPGPRPSIDLPGLAAAVAEWAAPPPSTPWVGVRQLLPGQALHVEGGRVVATTEWAATPADGLAVSRSWAGDGPPSAAELDELEAAVRGAVRSRTRSVGRLAVSVSGGVDSTVIGALAAEAGVRRSFGLVVDGDDRLTAWQQTVADAVGLEHTVHVLRPADLLADLVDFVATRRVPLVRLGPVGMTGLAGTVRRAGITAVLCGEGADELFGGYDSARVLAARDGSFGPPAQLNWGEFGAPEFAAERGPAWAAAYWRSLIGLGTSTPTRRSGILAAHAALFGPELSRAMEHHWAMPPPAAAGPAADARRDADLGTLLAGYLLTVQGDHAWMEEGVEQRPPWLADDVARWALSRPVRRLVAIGEGKVPVRDVLRRLTAHHPALTTANVPKEAFRVDASVLLGDAAVWASFTELIAACPGELLDVPAVLARAAACRAAGRCSEAESMILVLGASLGVLAGRDRP